MATIIRDEPDVIVANHLSRQRRISWGAVIAGVLMAIILQIMMNILGLAVGAAIVDPAEAVNPIGPTFSTGAVIWIAASTLIGIFAGGYIAAHLAGNPDETDSVLHGLLTWALGTVVVFLLLSSTASSVISGVSTLVSDGIGLIGASVEDVAPEVVEAFDVRDSVLEAIREEAGTVEGIDNTSVNSQLVIAVTNLVRADVDSENANESRQVATTLLVDEASLTQAEAEATVNDWEQQYRQTVSDAEELAEEAAVNLADALAATSGVLFVILVVGAFAGGAGGFVGRPDIVEAV